MDLKCFRDRLFDLLNDSEEMGIRVLNADKQNSLIAVRTERSTTADSFAEQMAGTR